MLVLTLSRPDLTKEGKFQESSLLNWGGPLVIKKRKGVNFLLIHRPFTVYIVIPFGCLLCFTMRPIETRGPKLTGNLVFGTLQSLTPTDTTSL